MSTEVIKHYHHESNNKTFLIVVETYKFLNKPRLRMVVYEEVTKYFFFKKFEEITETYRDASMNKVNDSYNKRCIKDFLNNGLDLRKNKKDMVQLLRKIIINKLKDNAVSIRIKLEK